MKTNCANCGKEIDRRPCRMKNLNYCNNKCQMEYEYKKGIRDKNTIADKAHQTIIKNSQKRFKTNPNIKISKRGYRMIYIPQVGWKREHTYFWELKNGPIPEGMILHHRDLNRFNNDLKNLVLMTNKDHTLLHWALKNIEKYKRFINM